MRNHDFACIAQELHFDQSRENSPCVISTSPASLRAPQPTLDVANCPGHLFKLSRPIQSPHCERVLDDGHSVFLDFSPVVAVREEGDALHASPGSTSPSNALVRRLSCVRLNDPLPRGKRRFQFPVKRLQ